MSKGRQDPLASYDSAVQKVVSSRAKRKRKNTPYDVAYPIRATYRFPDGLRERFKSIADHEGIGVNALMRWLVEDFCDRYERGEIDLPVVEEQIFIRALK